MGRWTCVFALSLICDSGSVPFVNSGTLSRASTRTFRPCRRLCTSRCVLRAYVHGIRCRQRPVPALKGDFADVQLRPAGSQLRRDHSGPRASGGGEGGAREGAQASVAICLAAYMATGGEAAERTDKSRGQRAAAGGGKNPSHLLRRGSRIHRRSGCGRRRTSRSRFCFYQYYSPHRSSSIARGREAVGGWRRSRGARSVPAELLCWCWYGGCWG